MVEECHLYIQFKLVINSKLILQTKSKGFNVYFAKKCRIIDNNNQLPDRTNFCTNERLNNIIFTSVDILILDTNKAHGHENVFIIIIKLCSD